MSQVRRTRTIAAQYLSLGTLARCNSGASTRCGTARAASGARCVSPSPTQQPCSAARPELGPRVVSVALAQLQDELPRLGDAPLAPVGKHVVGQAVDEQSM